MIQKSLRQLSLKLSVALTWRTPQARQKKLMAFAYAEQGSALDMFEAARACSDERCKALFVRHGLDELRHAKAFQKAAGEELSLSVAQRGSLSAVRSEGLFARLGMHEFLAFVHQAEKGAEDHFEVLIQKLPHPKLVELFKVIGTDESHHIAYSLKELQRIVPHSGQRGRVQLKVRARTLTWAWRRAGRQIGNVIATMVLNLLFWTALPLFTRFTPARAQPA